MLGGCPNLLYQFQSHFFKFVTFPVSNTVARSQLSSQQATMKLARISGQTFKRFYNLSSHVSSSKIKFSFGDGIIPSATNVIQTIFGFVSNIFLLLSILIVVYFIFCGKHSDFKKSHRTYNLITVKKFGDKFHDWQQSLSTIYKLHVKFHTVLKTIFSISLFHFQISDAHSYFSSFSLQLY